MPIYDRPIDTMAFQPLTTASSMENYGTGNMILDMGLAIGVESLGAGLMGAPGMFRGKPLMSAIPGVDPGGNAGKLLRRQMVDNLSDAGLFPDDMSVRQRRTSLNKKLNKGFRIPFLTSREARANLNTLRHLANSSAALGNDAARSATLNLSTRLGIGMGLKAFSSAWIINDMFSMGFSAASTAIQGLETFSYKRKLDLEGTPGMSADLGEGFADTRASFTQRQRAMQAIHNSQMNTRAAMGNEATFMHV